MPMTGERLLLGQNQQKLLQAKGEEQVPSPSSCHAESLKCLRLAEFNENPSGKGELWFAKSQPQHQKQSKKE